jgi:uncharacterized protein YdbL (DUF1318 family)
MKQFSIPVFLSVALVSCVTINIYFPAEEVRGAADQIARETWQDAPRTQSSQNHSSLLKQFGKESNKSLFSFGPATAYAQAQDININTPEIRAIRDSLRNRSSAIIPFMDSGHIGLGNDGLLKARSPEGLSLKDRAEVNKLVSADNGERERLYAAIARANGFPDKVDETRAIFADSWKAEARSGWYIEDRNGNWRQK